MYFDVVYVNLLQGIRDIAVKISLANKLGPATPLMLIVILAYLK